MTTHARSITNGRFAPLPEAGHGTHDLAELPPALQVSRLYCSYSLAALSERIASM
jgi:hypothetical protein